MTVFHKGAIVEAFPAGKEPFIGLIVAGPHKNDQGEEKYTVQVGAEKHEFGYREPPYDDHGPGGSFRKV